MLLKHVAAAAPLVVYPVYVSVCVPESAHDHHTTVATVDHHNNTEGDLISVGVTQASVQTCSSVPPSGVLVLLYTKAPKVVGTRIDGACRLRVWEPFCCVTPISLPFSQGPTSPVLPVCCCRGQVLPLLFDQSGRYETEAHGEKGRGGVFPAHLSLSHTRDHKTPSTQLTR